MSTHPNVILAVALTPDNLTRKTLRNILEESETDSFGDGVKIGKHEYNSLVMESDYDEGYQISGDEGDIIFFDLVTYGYGETISWRLLEEQKEELEKWVKDICSRYSCTYNIFVTANYW